MQKIAWGAKITETEKMKVIEVAGKIGIDPSDLMACMAFETGRTFSPAIRNAAGSQACGLIQFMPTTAKGLGTTIDALAKMTFVKQMDYVEKYFRPYKGKMKNFADVYMAILWPLAVGKADDYILFDAKDKDHPKRYIQNKGLDYNKDGLIVKSEVAMRVGKLLKEGMMPQNIG